MKYNMKYTKALGLALAALAFGACSEDTWDEHYNVQQVGTGESLWETISKEDNLSNFKRVVEACGYDAALASSQVFTVFAPTNDDLSAEEADALIAAYESEKKAGIKDTENSTIKEFIKNHIALFNYSVSGSSDDTLVMMNGKYLHLTPTTMGGKPLSLKNQLHSNGVLFTVNEQLDYFPNVFEALGKIEGLDSVAKFFYEYNQYEFMPEQSVPGGIVDGQTVYLDSVVELQNELFYELGRIASEDSSYLMVAPVNEDWTRMVEEFTPYFNYADNIFAAPVVDEIAQRKRDSLQYINTRLAILRGTVFSHTVNPHLADSARSTNAIHHSSRKYTYGTEDLHYYFYYKPYEEGGPFVGTEEIACSNGQVLKAPVWNIDKTQSFFQQIFVEGESRTTQAGIDGMEQLENPKTTITNVAVPDYNPWYKKISGKSFVQIAPTTAAVMPSATFYLPEVLSNIPYDIYVVMLPATASDTAATDIQKLPTRIRFTLGYQDQKGGKKEEVLQSQMATTGGDVIDTLLVGSNVVIPTCSFGLDEPQVTLEVENRVSTSQNNKTFTRTMRLDCIILKPHEEGLTSNN